MAEMFGISEDVIHDKAAFEALMAQGTYIYVYIYVYILTCVYIYIYIYMTV
jgi:hypothetical protein